jgi:hypothetical protein
MLLLGYDTCGQTLWSLGTMRRGVTPAFCASLASSATETTPIFCIRPMGLDRANRDALLSNPAMINRKTSNSRGVSFASRVRLSNTSPRCRKFPAERSNANATAEASNSSGNSLVHTESSKDPTVGWICWPDFGTPILANRWAYGTDESISTGTMVLRYNTPPEGNWIIFVYESFPHDYSDIDDPKVEAHRARSSSYLG